MARASDGTDAPVPPVPASSSNLGSPNGSLPDLDGTGHRAFTMEEKINDIFTQIARLPPLMQSISRFENCAQTLSQTVASYDAKITYIEQIVSSLAARVTMLETNATSVSSGSVPARSWNVLGRSDGSTPMARGRLMTIGIQDVSLILSQALRMHMRGVLSCNGSRANNTTLGSRNGSVAFGKNPTCQPEKSLSEFIAKQVPFSQACIRSKSQVSGLCDPIQR